MARHKVVIPAGRSFGSKKKRIYIAVTAVMLLLLGMAAAALLHSSAEKRTKEYVQKARESYSAGDYENALLYLRRVKEDAQSKEVLLLMADCYEAMENYPRALETLRKLNTADPAIANRIQAIEQRKLQQAQAKYVTVAGLEFEANTQSAVLDGIGMTDRQLQELTVLYALDQLSLQNNLLTDVTSLGQLKGLDELNLSGNRVHDISPLAELSGLRVLILDGNPVERYDALFALRYLSSLSLVDTDIDESALYEIGNALPDCAIRFGSKGAERVLMAGDVFSLYATDLSLSGKGLTDINMLKDFTELQTLDLSENEISDLKPLMELQKLEKLNLNDNAVSDLRPLIGLPVLTKLEAANNLITETASAGSIDHLTELSLRENPIKDFSGLDKLSMLNHLDLRDTGLTDADLAELSGLRSVYSIDLRDNAGLSDIAVSALKSALPGCSISTSELVYEIDFSGHHIRSDEIRLVFPAGGITDLSGLAKMTCLEELDLSDNEISNLFPFEITASRATIRKLNLANNRILDVLSLYALSGIEELDLSGNQIEVIAGLRKLTTLKELNLTGNPISAEAVSDLKAWLPNCEIQF